MFLNLTKLSTIAALIPVSTAECERAFSAMNRIKVDLRNRLKTTTLNSLMRISIEGPSHLILILTEQLICGVECQ